MSARSVDSPETRQDLDAFCEVEESIGSTVTYADVSGGLKPWENLGADVAVEALGNDR